MRVFISAIGSGFGDVLISLPVVQALIDKGHNVYLVRRSYRQEGIAERINGLCGEIAENDLQLLGDDIYINLRAHPIQTDHVWGSKEFEEQFGVARVEKIISLIARDHGLDVSYQDLRPLKFKDRPALRSLIAFVPGTDGYYKHWPKKYWLQLNAHLEQKGFATIVLGRPDESPPLKELIAAGIKWLDTPSAGDAIDVVSNVRAVVAVDTGLMHVAVQQGKATVSFVHPDNFHHRSAHNCIQFIGRHCPESCGRDNVLKPGIFSASALAVDLKFDHHICSLPDACDVVPARGGNEVNSAETLPQANCMSYITAEDVLQALEKLGVSEKTSSA